MKKIILLLIFSSMLYAIDIECSMKYSAVAELKQNQKIDVHTSSNDNIYVKITNIGKKIAYFNSDYELNLIKYENDVYYYLQSSTDGVVLWAYFKKTKSLTYAKIREFPVIDLPSSYLMIAKCREL